jgi:hypothetical protein
LTNLTTITGVTGADQVTLHFNDYVPGDVSTGLTEAWAGGNATDSQVNMSGVSTLAAALNLAAHEALHLNAGFGGHNHTTIVNQNTTAAAALLDIHTGILDWFQWNGNTYIVESVNNTAGLAAHAGLAAGDMVVELTGLVNVPNDVIVHFGT